jgi:alpha-tubulin suppressor-like RCC1 family protein
LGDGRHNQFGTGPGDIGILLAAGDFSSGSPDGLWAIYVDPGGTNIYFGGVSNSTSTVFVSAPISWPSNSAHLIGLVYGTNTVLYVDGQLAGTGGPVTIVPATNVWTNGFNIGSDASGYEQARGIFWDVELDSTNWFGFYNYNYYFINWWPYLSNGFAAWEGGGGSDGSSRVFDPMNAGGGCTNGGPVYLTNFSAALQTNGTTAISFDVFGGTNGVFYDLYTTTNLAGAWTWLGQVLTCNTYGFTNQPLNAAFYAAELPPVTMVVAWGDNTDGQCNIPSGLTNAVAVAAGDYFSLALLNNGKVIGWGDNSYEQTNIPSGLTNVVAIAAGEYHGVALLANGTVTNWGTYSDAINVYSGAGAPPSSNVMAIAASRDYDLALLSNGTIVSWGLTNDPTNNMVFTNLPPAQAIAAGWYHSVALLTNGTVVAWGENFMGQTNVPSDLTNAVAISANGYDSMALRPDGTVEAWGLSAFGATNVPEGLSNVVAVSEGASFSSLALQANGTVVGWGYTNPPNNTAYTIPPGVTGVKAIAAGFYHNLIIESGPSPVILEEPTNQYALATSNVTFSAEGVALSGVQYQWQFNGGNLIGATNATLMLTNTQASNNGNYQVVISTATGSITSLVATFTLVVAPEINYTNTSPGASGVYWSSPDGLYVGVANLYPPYPTTYQWQTNGTNISLATNANYNPTTDGAYTVVVTNAAGSTNVTWDVLLAFPGMVEAWGSDTNGECDRPATLTNATAIAAGDYHSVAVTDSGSVLQWGKYSDGTNFYAVGSPPSFTNVVAVAASRGHDIALKADGTVTNWGLTNDVANSVPTNLQPAKAVAAGWKHNVALLTNGTVVAWGDNSYNQTNVPSDLTNANAATAVAAAGYHSLALRANGTVEPWGDTNYGLTNIPSGLTNVVAIATGGEHSLALKSDGTVVAWGTNDHGQTNVPSGMSNFMAIAAGSAHSLALVNDGTLVAWGDNSDGQTNLPAASTNVNVKLIAAGGNHSMVAILSPLVQYPVDVSKDLLLIYNTNSTDSSNVCQYYLTHRPMVSNANVLGIDCVTNEQITLDEYTNEIALPIQEWLATNRTKRPLYVILFQDIPSRNDVYFPEPSVQYLINTACATNWNPFVTSINMNGAGGTNDCIAYINKLTNMASFGSNSPGQLFISASAGGYGNTNWYFDDSVAGITFSGPEEGFDDFGGAPGYHAEQGVLAANPSASIFLSYNAIITQGSNVAGYYSPGIHNQEFLYTYPTDGELVFSGNSDWYLIETDESYNGQRDFVVTTQGSFLEWYASNAFGGTSYSNTPVGAVSQVNEPGTAVNDAYTYFGLWASGKIFASCAWNSFYGYGAPYPQMIGDPFTKK